MKLNYRCGVVALLGALSAFVAGGCYTYAPPPAATQCDTYTQREKDERDDLFKDMKQLTRADAQRFASRLTGSGAYKYVFVVKEQINYPSF